MCMEDIRIGRKSSAKATAFNLGGVGVTSLVSADPKRTAISFYGGVGTNAVVFPSTIAASPIVGALINTGHPFQEFTLERHGLLVTMPWSVNDNAVAQTMMVVETRIDDV